MSSTINTLDAKTIGKYIEYLSDLAIWEGKTKRKLRNLSHSIRYTGNNDILWELLIDCDEPLEFKATEIDKRLQPDIFCELEISKNHEFNLKEYKLVIRIWSICEKMSYKKERDSDDIKKILESQDYKRVMFRCHMEKTTTKNEPIIHMQFGGIQRDGRIKECFFSPKNLKVPRFLVPPLDLVLAVQIIIANYFPEEYKKLKDDEKWSEMVKKSEMMFQGCFYKKCSDNINTNIISLYDSFMKN